MSINYLKDTAMPRLVEKLADGSNIKINNKYGNRVSTVVNKIVEKADNVTKAVEQEVVNEGYSFKVGTGNVDVSSSVEDGFTEINIKGNTIFKVNGELTDKWQENCEIVGVGDKSKNLFNVKMKLGALNTNGIEVSHQKALVTDGFIKIKENTSYVLNRVSTKYAVLYLYDKNYNKISFNGIIGNNSIRKFATPPQTCYFKFYHDDTEQHNIQLEEGDVSTKYEPYYEGHKIEILSSHGKMNLLTKQNCNMTSWIRKFPDRVKTINNNYNNSLTFVNLSSDWELVYTEINVENGKNYALSFDYEVLSKFDRFDKYNFRVEVSNEIPYAQTPYVLGFHDIENTPTNIKKGIVHFKAISNKAYIVINGGYINDGQTDIKFSFNNLKLEFGTKATSWVPPIDDTNFNIDKTQILLDEPLMKLPNGVADEIKDGKLIRRCLEYVTTSTENWSIRSSRENTITFNCSNIPFKSFKDFANSNVKMLSDSFICHNYDSQDKEYIMGRANGDGLLIGIKRNKLASEDLTGFKTWLEQNPIKVIMELETPIITELPAPQVRLFKDGHLTFNTLVAPTSTHKVLLNKSAQIEQSVREVQSLDSRVGKLESFYDEMILETAHKLSLLNMDFNYAKNIHKREGDE